MIRSSLATALAAIVAAGLSSAQSAFAQAAIFDPATGKLTLHITQQIPHMLRRMLAGALKFPEHKLRVLSSDVGGGFGPKMHFYPEEMVLSHLSRLLGRPVKWTEARRENIVATTHGRDHVMNIEVAAQRDGRILGLRITSLANVGAYLSSMGSGVPTVNVALFTLGIYAIPPRRDPHPLRLHQYHAGRCLPGRGALQRRLAGQRLLP